MKKFSFSFILGLLLLASVIGLLACSGQKEAGGLIAIEDQASFEEACDKGAFIFVTSSSCEDCKIFRSRLKPASQKAGLPVYTYTVQAFEGEDRHLDNMRRLQVMGTPALIQMTEKGPLDTGLTIGSTEEEMVERLHELRDEEVD